MNILLINQYAGGPEWGMEYRPYYFAREWVREGHAVTVISASFSHLRSSQPMIDGEFTHEQNGGINYIWCKTPYYNGNGIGRVWNIIVFLYRLSKWKKIIRIKPDVVIASSTHPADIFSARSIAEAYNAKLIWEVHDLWPLSPMELGGMSKWHPFILWMQYAENFACKASDRVVSILPKTLSHLEEHGMCVDKFKYIPNGIDPVEWSCGSSLTLPAAHIEAISQARGLGRFLVGYTGAHGVANALDTLLDTIKISSDLSVTWFFVGTGSEKKRLHERVTMENIKHVEFLAPISKKSIPLFLKMMDALYIGLQHQSLFRFGISPNKLMDYMMAEKPIINSIKAGNDPVCEAKCGISVPPEDPEAIYKAVKTLLSMTPEERHTMGQRGRDYIEANQTFPLLADRFIKTIEKE
jgi:glycosyltransferase involved in cell wall biosynthesis